MGTLTNIQTFNFIECDCGVYYAITDDFIKNRRNDHKTFYCPNGCRRHYPGKNEEEKLRERLTRETNERKFAEAQLNRERTKRKSEENSHRTTRGHITRIKNRISAGVCPCCNRTFQNLKRHMEGQHPRFKNK